VGEFYTYNLIKGYEHHVFKPGDRIKLLHTRDDLGCHVEVESEDGSYAGKIHFMCLMLDRVYK